MDIQPEFQSNEGFRIVGVERYTASGIASIREAWDEFGKRFGEIEHAVDASVCYGFEDYSRDFDLNRPDFPKYYYIAALEVDQASEIPPGMVTKEIPAANYAVFRKRGSLEELPQFFGYIYNSWLPTSGYNMDSNVMGDFERYPEEVTDMQNALVEIWIPVTK